MDHPAKLVIAAFLASLGAFAHAGYAQLADPVGFSGGPNDWKYAPAANDQSFGKVVHQPNGLKVPVPGKVVTMPASYRFASNAGRVAAGFVFMNPYVRTALNIAGWLLAAKLMWDSAEGIWRQIGPELDGLQYQGAHEQWFATADAACQSVIGYENSRQADYTYELLGFNSATKACTTRFRPVNSTGAWTNSTYPLT